MAQSRCLTMDASGVGQCSVGLCIARRSVQLASLRPMRFQLPFAASLVGAIMSGSAPSFDARAVELLIRNARELCLRSWELGTVYNTLIELYRAAATLRIWLRSQIRIWASSPAMPQPRRHRMCDGLFVHADGRRSSTQVLSRSWMSALDSPAEFAMSRGAHRSSTATARPPTRQPSASPATRSVDSAGRMAPAPPRRPTISSAFCSSRRREASTASSRTASSSFSYGPTKATCSRRSSPVRRAACRRSLARCWAGQERHRAATRIGHAASAPLRSPR